MTQTHSFFATTAKGMEDLLVDELVSFRAEKVVKTRAGVAFEGTLETAYRACLWSRIANRILLPLGTFDAPNPEKLYGGVKSLRWSDHISHTGTLSVDFTSTTSQITHTHFGALKTKDAIVDQLREVKGERPSVDFIKPDVRVNVYVLNDVATVSIDLSGESLHKRGYREEGVLAPLKENLAAAMLKLAGWEKACAEGADFLDVMCGSGTLPIEAALMACRIAPGINRKHFGFSKWLGHDPKVWKNLVEEAMDLEVKEDEKLPRIVGYDEDPEAVRASLSNLERAGVHGRVHIEKRELSTAEATGSRGILMVNPPYGERLGEVEELKPLYEKLGDTFKKKFKGWEAYVFTSNPDLVKCISLKASRRFVLFNGALECRLLKYEMYEGTKRTDAPR